MDREFEVIWTEPAIDDLQALIVHIARTNPTTAERIRLAILNHVKILKTFPLIGPIRRKEPRRQNREITYKSYRIFYRVLEDRARVEILAVWHASRQDPDGDS